jgi:hypothetical protein
MVLPMTGLPRRSVSHESHRGGAVWGYGEPTESVTSLGGTHPVSGEDHWSDPPGIELDGAVFGRHPTSSRRALPNNSVGLDCRPTAACLRR